VTTRHRGQDGDGGEVSEVSLGVRLFFPTRRDDKTGTGERFRKRHTMEFLRSVAHLRPRTNITPAVMRVRNALAFAIHRFFQERSFYWIHTPIVTASDAEGAGAMFRVP
jgi:aspartyl/asparaginyl-tRNA synthetase